MFLIFSEVIKLKSIYAIVKFEIHIFPILLLCYYIFLFLHLYYFTVFCILVLILIYDVVVKLMLINRYLKIKEILNIKIETLSMFYIWVKKSRTS